MMSSRLAFCLLLLLTLLPGRAATVASIDDCRQIPGHYNRLITQVLRHSSGMVWLGSSNGLLRYDGYTVAKAPLAPGEPDTTVGDYINNICEDSEGRLWLNTMSGFTVYDPATHSVVHDMGKFMIELGIPEMPITVNADKGGNLWIATEKGFYRLQPGAKKADAVTGPGLPPYRVTAIEFQGSTPVIVDETGALRWIDPAQMKVTAHAEPGPVAARSGKQSYLLTIDRKNRYWVYGTSAIDIYDGSSRKWISDRIASRDLKGNTRYIYESNSGNLWIAHDNHGFERIDTDASGRFHFSTIDRKGSFTHDITITHFLEDRPGSLWLGTYKKGLLMQNDFIRKFSTEPLSDVNCMLPQGGGIWVGTDNRGLLFWDLKTGAKTPVPDPSEGDTPAAITTLALAADGKLYVGAFYHGLRISEGGKLHKITTGSGLDNAYVWTLAADGHGNLWAGTLGDGVYRLDTHTGKAVKVKDARKGLPSPYVQSAVVSEDGRVYFGTANGIGYFDPSDGLLHDLTDLSPEFKTDGWRVTQLLEDSRGLLWAATGWGLNAIDRKNNRVDYVADSDGLQMYRSVTGLEEDNDGSLWVSEERAFSSLKVNYDPATGDIDFSNRYYDSRDGLMDCDFNQRSFAKLPDGEILVGGLDGVNRFKPSEIRYNTGRPKVVFTDLTVDDDPMHPGQKLDGREVIGHQLSDGITIPPGSHDFTVYFASDNYALPEKTRYIYRLDGYTDEWRTLAEGQHSVTYTNLSPGSYRLLVRAVNSDGFESELPAILPIRVVPPFWASIWAIAIYILLGAAAIGFGIYLFSTRERRRLKKISDRENLRKQEELNQMKFRFFTNISHDLRTPLSLIISPLDEMLKEEPSDPKQRHRLELMKSNSTKLLSLVNQLLDFRKAEMAGLQFTPKDGDIVEFTRNICQSFEGMADRKHIQLSFHSSYHSIRMQFDPDKLEKTFMNLLGNAFKFTKPGGEVFVSVNLTDTDPKRVAVGIADTGCGIPDKDKPHIFDRFFQANDKRAAHENMGSGIGLSLVKEYVGLHNGTVRVEDNTPRGSIFTFELPLRQKVARISGGKYTGFAHDADNPPASPAQEAKTCQPDHRSPGAHPRVLVIDDNPDMREMLKFELSDEFDIRTAPDGERALSDLRSHRPDIILTDLMMPGIDGIELCRILRSDPATVSIPIIIITAKHDVGVKIEGLTLGADDYITKPFDMDVLRLRMRRFVELSAKGATRTLMDPEPAEIKITPLDEKMMEKAMDYVSENIDNSDLTVEQLSEYLGMSRVRLYKKIKQITGKTPIEFIRIIRLKRAAQMLRESQLNVSEVAYRTGFNSPKLFSKYFKEEFGILPSLYQNREAKPTTIDILGDN